MVQNSEEQLAQDEIKVIVELQKNAHENMETIARRCGFSRQKIWRIMQHLEKSHEIWGYSAVTNEQKQGLQKFVLLMKRSTKPIDDNTANELISYRKDKDIMNLGITVENSYYSHGAYDWILIFTAQDMSQAKKFSDTLLNKHPGMVSKVELIQILMTMRSQHILNPEYEKLREFL